jgi:uncharacterized protein involved in exopolysaccharide biosynthesis
MLQIYKTDNSADQATTPPEFAPVEFLAAGVAFIRRRLWVICLTCLVTLFIALIYLVTAVPTFIANAQFIVDSRAAAGDAASVSTIVESQIAIIKSEGIARTVIEKLGLARDPEFSGQSAVRSMIRSTLRLLGWRGPETDSVEMGRALESFNRKLSVKRVRLTYIIEVTFDSIDPGRAAQIVNTLAETYTWSLMDAKYRSNSQSEKWLWDRTNELSSQASAAKKAVADYYRKNDIAGSVGAGNAGAPPPQLMPRSQGELRELEAAAEAAARSYDNFLRVQRFLEAQQQSLSIIGPASEAHVLTEASRPLRASSPKVGIVLGISIVGGLFVGILVGMMRDLSDRGILTSGQELRDWELPTYQVDPAPGTSSSERGWKIAESVGKDHFLKS